MAFGTRGEVLIVMTKMNKNTLKAIASFLFVFWLLGLMGKYSIGWLYHGLLIVSVMLLFIALVSSKRVDITEIMEVNSLSENDAVEVREFMDKHKLSEKEALELWLARSKSCPADTHHLIQTELRKIRQIEKKHKLSELEAMKLLIFRLRLRV